MEFNDGSQYRVVTDPAAYMATRDLYCARAASARGGVMYKDTAMDHHRAAFSGIAGLCWYQFPWLNAGSPEKQAEFFLQCIDGLRWNEMVMIDPEPGGGFTKANVQAFVRRWLAVVEPALDTRAWIYVPSALSEGLPRSFTVDRIVMAPYYSKKPTRGLAPWWPWDIHQFTDIGPFPGVGAPGSGDTNYTPLTTAQILARCNPNGINSPSHGR